MNAAAAFVAVLGARQPFNPVTSLFAHGEQGVVYDPTDLSTLFQDSAGTTPVTAVEQAVGLILDKSKGLVIGPELVTNGDFSSGTTGWTFYAGSTITPAVGSVTSGVCTITSADAGNTARARQTISTFVVGRTYRISATVSTSTGQPALMVANGDELSNIFAQESYSNSARDAVLYWTATATSAKVGVRCAGAGNAVFDNISVRELAGNHAIQPTAASRPVLRARYNLLTYSEQFDNAAWTQSGATVTQNAAVAPNGTTTADKLITNAAASNGYATQTATLTAGTVYTFSCYAKTAGATNIRLRATGSGSWASVIVDLTTGVVSGTLLVGTPTVTNVGNDFYRISITGTCDSSGSNTLWVYDYNTGDGTSGVYLWGADLRRTIDAISGIPNYQRIAAATDYDTVGFPVYLAFDGSDDSLYTSSIDFSATDKMTVFTGVTKLSDAATTVVAELSADTAANNGVFRLSAPASSGTHKFLMLSKGTAAGQALTTSTTWNAPVTAVVSGLCDIAGDNAQLRLDGAVENTDTADQGTGNYGNYPLYIGRRNNATLPFNGRLASLIVRGAPTSAALITQAERWIAGKQGRVI